MAPSVTGEGGVRVLHKATESFVDRVRRRTTCRWVFVALRKRPMLVNTEYYDCTMGRNPAPCGSGGRVPGDRYQHGR